MREPNENITIFTRKKNELIAEMKYDKLHRKIPRNCRLLQHYHVLEVQRIEKLIVRITNTKHAIVFNCSVVRYLT